MEGLENGWSGILRGTECSVETNKYQVKYEANVSELACEWTKITFNLTLLT